jgi:hypothetical protein
MHNIPWLIGGDLAMNTRRVESFLLRLVIHEGEETLTPQQWRGRIQHVATGTELQIDQLEEAVAFITTHLGRVEAEDLPNEPTAAQ